ncbi:hypothetical protein GGF32_004028 [Allomyces javanicus]|nr:hypothetical protein GGF32_004028 [Allomyces javanicus]
MLELKPLTLAINRHLVTLLNDQYRELSKTPDADPDVDMAPTIGSLARAGAGTAALGGTGPSPSWSLFRDDHGRACRLGSIQFSVCTNRDELEEPARIRCQCQFWIDHVDIATNDHDRGLDR